MIAPSRTSTILRRSAPVLKSESRRSLRGRVTSGMLEELDRIVPPESRGRRLLAWGVVAWTGVGIALVLWLLSLVLARVAGIFPYLVVAGLVVLTLNPVVKALVRIGLPRRVAATVVFAVVALGLPPLIAFGLQ